MQEPRFEEEAVYTLTDGDGQELHFLLDATLELQGKLYAVLYPYDPIAQEVIDDKLYFVLDEDDTLSVVDTEELFRELDELYLQLEQLEDQPATELQ